MTVPPAARPHGGTPRARRTSRRHRLPLWLLLVAAAASACDGVPPQPAPESAPAQEPSPPRTADSPTAAEQDGAVAVSGLFGTGLRPREEGSFGLDRWVPLPADEPDQPARAFRVEFPEGSVSPSSTREQGAPGGGMQVFALRTDGPLDEAYLHYRLRLPDGFEPVKGGKLPGLFGGSEVSGGEEPDGTDGFSTRLMWREDLAGELYVYAPDEAGSSIGRGAWTWPTGRWACVEQHVVLNDPGDTDGRVTVWLDGREVLVAGGLLFRTVPDLQIEGLFFSTFFGGDDPSWASPSDQHADFADFGITRDRVGCAT